MQMPVEYSGLGAPDMAAWSSATYIAAAAQSSGAVISVLRSWKWTDEDILQWYDDSGIQSACRRLAAEGVGFDAE